MKKLSFCITCKNRFHQISKTLPQNLSENGQYKDIIEFVLVDFGSQDGLQDWVLSNFTEALETGYLRYLYTDEMKSWNASVAKNTSHLYARGEFLVNLDCDDFTGDNGGYYIYTQFLKYGHKSLLHQFDGSWKQGNYGRISMHRKFFFAVGGYDESFEPMAHQDTDLINRLSESGLTYKRLADPKYLQTIQNTKTESTKYCDSNLLWEQMEIINARSSRNNLFSGRVVANNGSLGVRHKIFTYSDKKMIPAGSN